VASSTRKRLVSTLKTAINNLSDPASKKIALARFRRTIILDPALGDGEPDDQLDVAEFAAKSCLALGTDDDGQADIASAAVAAVDVVLRTVLQGRYPPNPRQLYSALGASLRGEPDASAVAGWYREFVS